MNFLLFLKYDRLQYLILGPTNGYPQPPGAPQAPNQAPQQPPQGAPRPGPPGQPAQPGPGPQSKNINYLAPPSFPTVPGMQPPGPPGPQPGFAPRPPGMAGGPGMPAPGFPGGQPGMPQGAPGGYPGAQGPPGAFPTVPEMAPQGGYPGPGMGGFPPGPGAPGMPGMPGAYPPQQPPKKLDANMMPSAVDVMTNDEDRGGLFPTGSPTAEVPPLTSTDFYCQDQGNCNPRLMRSTLYAAPTSGDMLKTTQIPFAVGCTPFAKFHQNEASLPVIDLGPGGPVRCARCKAYMCPFLEFQDGGRKFKCPFCQASSQVEELYFAHLDHTGRRTDLGNRPELYSGAYEFVATKQYCKNGVAPKEPAYIFMIGVSYPAISNGLVHVACGEDSSEFAKVCLDLFYVFKLHFRETGQSESSIRVGLSTFDTAVHFYDLSSPKSNMLIIGDVNEMFVPIVDGLLLPYSQALPALRAVLQEIPKLFAENRATETILGPVITAGMDALQNALVPQCEFYSKLGEQCVKAGVTVDLFLFPNDCIDVATISHLSAVTGGSVYKHQFFNVQKDAVRFLSDLHHNVSWHIGFDCMVKVRSSAAIRPVSFSGSFYVDKATDLEFASIDEDKTFFAELKHDDNLSESAAVIQTAILYTSITGQGKLRILNLCLGVTQDYNQMYRMTDQDTLVTYLLRIAVSIHREKSNKEIKETLAQDVLKFLPVIGAEMTVDDKVWMIELLHGLKIPDTLRILYPRVIPVSDLELHEPTDNLKLPTPIRASMENFKNESAYLIDNGIVLFLWIGLGISAEWVKDVFGADSLTQIDTESHVIPEKDNNKSRALRRAIQMINSGPRRRKFILLREKDSLEPWMRKFLIEDKNGPNDMSYVDYVCYIHREIRGTLS